MDMSAHNLKPYIIALLIFVCGAIVINYLAVPNTLSHDKLNGELFLIKSQHPEFFSKDYIFEGTSWYFFYVPFLEFIRLLNGFTGASEESYCILVCRFHREHPSGIGLLCDADIPWYFFNRERTGSRNNKTRFCSRLLGAHWYNPVRVVAFRSLSDSSRTIHYQGSCISECTLGSTAPYVAGR